MLGSITSFLDQIPEIAKVIGSMITGAFGFFTLFYKHLQGRRKTERELVGKYRSKYIEISTDYIESTTNETKQRRLLAEMRTFCPECYQEASNKTGITIE